MYTTTNGKFEIFKNLTHTYANSSTLEHSTNMSCGFKIFQHVSSNSKITNSIKEVNLIGYRGMTYKYKVTTEKTISNSVPIVADFLVRLLKMDDKKIPDGGVWLTVENLLDCIRLMIDYSHKLTKYAYYLCKAGILCCKGDSQTNDCVDCLYIKTIVNQSNFKRFDNNCLTQAPITAGYIEWLKNSKTDFVNCYEGEQINSTLDFKIQMDTIIEALGMMEQAIESYLDITQRDASNIFLLCFYVNKHLIVEEPEIEFQNPELSCSQVINNFYQIWEERLEDNSFNLVDTEYLIENNKIDSLRLTIDESIDDESF